MASAPGVVGLAVNYSKPKVNFGNDAADNESKSLQLGGYGAFGIAGGFVQAYAGYGWDEHDIERAGVVEEHGGRPRRQSFHRRRQGRLSDAARQRPGRPGGRARLCQGQGRRLHRDRRSGADAQRRFPELQVASRQPSGSSFAAISRAAASQLRPFAAAVVEKDFTGDERTVRFAQTSAPTIVNSFALEDASKEAYGRMSLGFSAAIFSSVSLDVARLGDGRQGPGRGDLGPGRLPLRLLGCYLAVMRSFSQGRRPAPGAARRRRNDQRRRAGDRDIDGAGPGKGFGDVARAVVGRRRRRAIGRRCRRDW